MAGARGYVLIVVLSVIWGLAFVAIRRADFELSSVNLTLLRWVIVSAGFLVIYPLVIKPRVKFERKDFPRLLLVALTSVVIYHLALNTAEKQVDASLAGLLISLAPLTTVLLSSVVLHEKLGGRLWFALVLAIAGSVTISSPDLSLSSTTAAGPLLVVLAAVSSGIVAVSSKPLTTKYGPFPVAAWSAFLGTAILLPLGTQGLVSQAAALSAYGWASVIYLSILSTVLANLIYFTLVSRQRLSSLGLQLYLVPAVSAVGGVLILGESLGVPTVVGGALLLVAVGLATPGRQ
ncbi:MAG TPA: DMT family transporter [Nitrososphaerales archaeon]|nr:DMT family transporter [Nitrososphaerales archaeon]